MWYHPRWYHRLASILLLPMSRLYCSIATLKARCAQSKDFGVPVVSVGNLIAGGSGKSPIVQTLAKNYEKAAVVLRGYGRRSRGLVVVSRWGEIEVDVERSGDEAMMLAKALPKACVIVSEDRAKGIQKAKELGAKVVFLDDGFRHCLKKLDILIDVSVPNSRCLPSGPYRLPKKMAKRADIILQESKDFIKEVQLLDPKSRMVLLTAIANPKRLDPYLPRVIARYEFGDHHDFTKEELERIWRKERPDSFLVTAKDAVKLERYGYPLSILKLNLTLSSWIYERVEAYVKEYYAKKDPDRSDAA